MQIILHNHAKPGVVFSIQVLTSKGVSIKITIKHMLNLLYEREDQNEEERSSARNPAGDWLLEYL